MLSPHDAELVRRDTAIPGLATLLDAEAFARCLRQYAPEAEIERVYPIYVRYKPHMNCLVGYNLEVGGSTVDLYAKAYRAGAQEQLQKAKVRGGSAGPLGRGQIVLPGLSSVVSIFPNDNRLKSLARLADADTEGALVRRVFSTQPHLWEGKTHPIRYKPERRYVARFDVEGQPEAVLKFHTPHSFMHAKRNARAFRSRELLQIPVRMGHSKRHGVLAFEWMSGQLLSDAFLDPGFSPTTLVQVGVALAEIHAHNPVSLTPATRENEAVTLLALSSWLGFLYPPIAARAKCLAERLGTLLSEAPQLYSALHGDFYAKQVLLDNDGVVVLDFDSAAAGDPASDLGLFVAHLERGALRGNVPTHLVEECTNALLEGYAHRTGRPVPEMSPIYTAVGLLKLSPHPFRSRQDNWGDLTECIIARAEKLLNAAAPRARVYISGSATSTIQPNGVPSKASRWDVTDAARATVHDPFNVTTDPTMPCLTRALDPHVFSRLLMQHLPGLTADQPHLQLLGIRVVRHKPGRRCLIEYQVQIKRDSNPPQTITLLGKVRARGVDKTTYDTMVSLWNGDFGPMSQDGVLVPQPVGIVPELNMWLHYKVPGEPATRLLGKAGGVELAGRIAEASYKLHQAGVPARRCHLMADELRILHEKLPLVAQIHTVLARRIQSLLDSCTRLATLAPKPLTLKGIHRDFYPDQVLVDGERLYLLDFDLYCEGDPALDIGNFLGHMREYGLRTTGSPDAFKEHEQAMVERFVQLSGEATRPRIEVYSLLTLARHVYLSTQFPERRAHTETLLGLCEEELDTLLRTPAGV